MSVCAVNNRSALYHMAVELYLRHQPDGVDRCLTCGRFACATRQHAADVIWAAGVDPALYGSPPRQVEATNWSRQPTVNLFAYRRSDNSL